VNAKAIRQNTAKKRYVPQVIDESMSGVTKPMIKLHIHVAEVVIEIAFDRIERLKISEGRTHPIGAAKPINITPQANINTKQKGERGRGTYRRNTKN
jgi:hypothetical protein